MKTLKDFITEGYAVKNEEIEVVRAHKGKFGFMVWNDNAEQVSVISFDKLADYAALEGFDVDDYMGIDKCDVGESVYDGASYIYTRIW